MCCRGEISLSPQIDFFILFHILFDTFTRHCHVPRQGGRPLHPHPAAGPVHCQQGDLLPGDGAQQTAKRCSENIDGQIQPQLTEMSIQ